MTSKFRKKPVVIEAVQWDGKMTTIEPFVVFGVSVEQKQEGGDLYIVTPEGVMRAEVGDWIIKGVNGEFYPCKPDIFAKTYEQVNP